MKYCLLHVRNVLSISNFQFSSLVPYRKQSNCIIKTIKPVCPLRHVGIVLNWFITFSNTFLHKKIAFYHDFWNYGFEEDLFWWNVKKFQCSCVHLIFWLRCYECCHSRYYNISYYSEENTIYFGIVWMPSACFFIKRQTLQHTAKTFDMLK